MPSSPRSEPARFSGRHLFVTGGTGFLGRSLLDYLVESATLHGSDFEATILTRDPQRFLDQYPEYGTHEWLRFVAGDLLALPRPPRPITDLIHAAADTHRSDTNKIAWFDQLVGGTRNVLEYAREQGVQRMLYISSGAVYGSQPADVIALAENLPHGPLPTDTASVYGTGKRLAEHLCSLYAEQYGLHCVIARCFAILSEHMPLNGPFAAGNFLRDALARETIQVRGNGQAIRTYLDGRDTAHWLATLLERGLSGDAYNVGSDAAITVLALAQRIGRLLAPGKPIVVENAGLDGPRSIYVPDIAKARALGMDIETDLDRAIRDAALGRLRS